MELCGAPRRAGRVDRAVPKTEPFNLSRLSFRQFAALFAALFAIAATPVLLCDTLPLFDYPNHMARMHILTALPSSEALQRFYEIAWRPLPNLAMDLLVPPLARIMPLAWAGKAFVLLTLFLIAGGAATLHRALFGGWSAWPCLAFLLLYSRILLWGFLNYLFGLGLGLMALSLWIALGRRKPAIRLVVGIALAFALFFSHLLAFGLYGVMVMGYELGLLLRRRPVLRQAAGDLVLAAAPFLPMLAILFFAMPGAAAGAITFGRPVRKLDLLFSVFDNYNRPFDVVCFALVVVALVLSFWRRWVRLDPAILIPLALLVLVYLIMPSQLATASGADHRIPLLLGLVLFAGSRWIAPRVGTQRIFLGAALVLFLLRLGVVTSNWQASDRLYASFLPAFDHIPVGSRVAVAYSPDALNSEATPLVHFPTLAIVRRDAFVPTLFAFGAQQPVALRPPYRTFAEQLPPERLWDAFVTGAAPLDEGARSVLANYDFIAFVGRRSFTLAVAGGLVPAFVAPRFALFHVVHGDRS